MNYISAEQFQEQPKEVQEVLLKWWKPSKGDIFAFLGDDTSREIGVLGDSKEIQIATKGKGEYRLPLLTEGQLREFIEDKTKAIVSIGGLDDGYYGMLVMVKDSIETCKNEDELPYFFKSKDILQLYWKVACQIAEEVANE